MLRALHSSGVRLLGGGLALCRIPTIEFLASSILPKSVLSLRRPSSTAATICGTGTVLGVGTKFSPLDRTDVSAGESCLEERLVTHLSVAWWVGLVPVRRCKNQLNFRFSRVAQKWRRVRTSQNRS